MMMTMILTALCGLMATTPLQTGNDRVSIEAPAQERIADSEKQAADTSAPRTLAFYAMTDLLAPPGEPTKEFLLSAEKLREREEAEAARFALFTDTIREHVNPSLVQGLDEIQAVSGGTLVVTGTAQHHDWIRTFLDLQRDEPLQFLLINSSYLRGKGMHFKGAGFDGPSQVWESEGQLTNALATVSATEGVELVTAPKLMVLPTQHAEMSILKQMAYVKSYEVVYVHPGPVAIADPVIDVIHEGFVFDLTAIQVEPGLYALNLNFERSEIERPIPTKEVKVAVDVDSTMTISQPVVTSSKLSSTVLLRSGANVWFRIPDGEQELLITVQMTVILPEQEVLESADESTRGELPKEERVDRR